MKRGVEVTRAHLLPNLVEDAQASFARRRRLCPRVGVRARSPRVSKKTGEREERKGRPKQS